MTKTVAKPKMPNQISSLTFSCGRIYSRHSATSINNSQSAFFFTLQHFMKNHNKLHLEDVTSVHGCQRVRCIVHCTNGDDSFIVKTIYFAVNVYTSRAVGSMSNGAGFSSRRSFLRPHPSHQSSVPNGLRQHHCLFLNLPRVS